MVSYLELCKRAWNALLKGDLVNLHLAVNMKAYSLMEEGSSRDEAEEKRKILTEVVNLSPKLAELQAAQDQLKEAVESLRKIGYQTKVLKGKLSYRGLVGLQEAFGKALFEVGLTWDPLLQLPYIPGSTVKGAARATAEDMNPELVKKLYGDEEKLEPGELVFLDAYPSELGEGGRLLEPEVITPTYATSFEEHRVKPTPIVFLSIAQGVVFKFAFAAESQDDVEVATKHLTHALRYGIGAKTLTGFTTFVPLG